MRCTALATTLLLTLAALASGAALPPTLGRVIGLGPTCRKIGAQLKIARGLETTASFTTPRDTEAAAVVPRSPIPPRDNPGQYNPCGILRGHQRSAPFTLDPNNIYNAFWVDDRIVIGAHILLWELGGGVDHMVDSAEMHLRHLNPFTPAPNRQYALELWAQVPGGENAVASWWFGTQ